MPCENTQMLILIKVYAGASGPFLQFLVRNTNCELHYIVILSKRLTYEGTPPNVPVTVHSLTLHKGVTQPCRHRYDVFQRSLSELIWTGLAPFN